MGLRSLLFSLGYFFISLIQLVVLFLLSRNKIRNIYSRLDVKEEGKRIEGMRPHVTPGETVLDVGAGSGRFGKVVQEALKVKVTGVDVCDYSDHTIPFFVYDGKKLPFPDKSFDVVFFAFVLHHIRDQEVIFREACRVARHKIVIFEDTFVWPWEWLFTAWNDYHTNIFQGWIKYWKGYFKGSPAGMPMPFTFRSVKGWTLFFRDFPIEVVSAQVRTMGYKPLTKVTFCLKIVTF